MPFLEVLEKKDGIEEEDLIRAFGVFGGGS